LAHGFDLNLEPIEVEELFDAVLDNYQIVAKDREILLRKKVGTTPQPIRGDRRRLERLEQVLGNLVSNALKFTPADGAVELGADWTHAETTVWVKDTGIGIAPEEIGNLFEKYKQTTSGKTSEYKGTGLGLAICKMIVQAHGGKIWAESRPNEGSKIAFTLPANHPS
jgi:signal transduction histidine kinase